MVLQGVKSNYETDLLRPMIDFTATAAGKIINRKRRKGSRCA